MPKQLAEMDGALEFLQVRPEGLVDANLADGRADGAELEAFAIEQGLEIGDLCVAERQHVRFQDRTEFDVPDAAAFEDGDLLLRLGRYFVGEGRDDEHGGNLENFGQGSGVRRRGSGVDRFAGDEDYIDAVAAHRCRSIAKRHIAGVDVGHVDVVILEGPNDRLNFGPA